MNSNSVQRPSKATAGRLDSGEVCLTIAPVYRALRCGTSESVSGISAGSRSQTRIRRSRGGGFAQPGHHTEAVRDDNHADDEIRTVLHSHWLNHTVEGTWPVVLQHCLYQAQQQGVQNTADDYS